MIPLLSSQDFSHKKVLLRVDFNVSLNSNASISNDTRIQQAIPTIKLLLKRQNKIILIAHLGEPKKRDAFYSLKNVAKDLAKYIPSYHVRLVKDFLKDKTILENQKSDEVLMLENIRFYPEEQANDQRFAQELASLAQIYVNDAFGVCHREDASVVSIPKYLPSFAGLLLEKEVAVLNKVITHPQHPFLAILGGSKISTKIKLINKLMKITDAIVVGGGLANTFLAAQDRKVGKSLYEKEGIPLAKEILKTAKKLNTNIVIPRDVIVSRSSDKYGFETSVANVKAHDTILDIGSETQAIYGQYIAAAKTIIWNGPVGKFEEPEFSRGTEFIYYAITQNTKSVSVVGGGDTIAAISKKEYLDHITHISTGGGAMLTYIELGTLPGVEALKKSITA